MMRARVGLTLILFASPVVTHSQQAPPAARAEAQFGQRLARVVRDRLGLTDPQMLQLQRVNQAFEQKRRTIAQQERDLRMSLRDELMQTTPNNDKVSDLIARMLRVQHQRIDLLEQEQKDLSAFMTPVQRAKYLALQDQIRRRAAELRARGGAGAAAAPRGRRLRAGSRAP